MRLLALGMAAALTGEPAPSGTLSELKAALERLRPAGALSVRLTMETSGEFRDEGEDRTRKGRASVVAEDRGGARTIALVYDDRTLSAAANEPAGMRDSQGPADALRALDAFKALDLLRPAERWLEDLEGATLLSEKNETRQGRPVRALELALKAPRGLDREKGLRIDRKARLWIDETGTPVASEIRTHTEFRRFIIKVKFDTTVSTEYQTVSGRLLASEQTTENHWKAWIIAEGSNRSVTRVEPLEK